MSLIQVKYPSAALSRNVEYFALIPNDTPPDWKAGNKHYERPMQTLILLHGFSACGADWIGASGIEELSMRYHLAVLMPNGENSFYLDREETGAAYSTFVAKELLEHARSLFHLSERREDTFIGGYSMGGFGAIRNGLKYAETYSKIIGLSNALICYMLPELKRSKGNEIANLAYYERIFGDLDDAHNTDKHPEYIANELLRVGKEIPALYLACGTEDFLLDVNRKWNDYLTAQGIKHFYTEDAGSHDWVFWNKYLAPALEWLTSAD